MIIELSDDIFINDFFSTMLPDGKLLIVNKVDEDFISGNKEGIVKAVSIEIQDVDDNIIDCPCVIGLGNDLMQINTKYKDYEGKVLSPDNMAYCTIEIYEG